MSGPGNGNRRTRRATLVLVALACTIGSTRCTGKADDAPAVAAPSLVLRPADPIAGAPVEIAFAFLVAADAPAFREDYRVFVHFLNAQGRLLWTYDHQPSVPTRQWKPGERIAYTRATFVADVTSPGPITVSVGLFSPETGERLPLAGPSDGDRSYAVASFTPGRGDTPFFISFTSGWHGTESAGADSAEEWRWSSKTGTVSLRNPGRDITLLLEVDQPSEALPSQQIALRLGDAVIDTFSLTPGARELRRIDIDAAALGGARTSAVTLEVDRTFVPAAIAALGSSDARELGIRLLHAYIQAR